MDELKLQTEIMETLMGEADELPDKVDYVRTFEDAGVMTSNRGLVISMCDGTQFQVTIVQSR